MGADSGLQDVTFDSTTAQLRFGTLKAGLTKFEPPAVETKVERVRRIGEDIATIVTAGATEIADCTGEMLITDYVKILARMPKAGGHLVTFNIVMRHATPVVGAEYSILLDMVRITKRAGPALDQSGAEKAQVKQLGFNVRAVWEMGADRIWKCAARVPTVPTPSAKFLMSRMR